LNPAMISRAQDIKSKLLKIASALDHPATALVLDMASSTDRTPPWIASRMAEVHPGTSWRMWEAVVSESITIGEDERQEQFEGFFLKHEHNIAAALAQTDQIIPSHKVDIVPNPVKTTAQTNVATSVIPVTSIPTVVRKGEGHKLYIPITEADLARAEQLSQLLKAELTETGFTRRTLAEKITIQGVKIGESTIGQIAAGKFTLMDNRVGRASLVCGRETTAKLIALLENNPPSTGGVMQKNTTESEVKESTPKVSTLADMSANIMPARQKSESPNQYQRRLERENRIVRVLRKNLNPMKLADLANKVGWETAVVAPLLNSLLEQKRVQRLEDGFWWSKSSSTRSPTL
jgi:hypothetical protein